MFEKEIKFITDVSLNKVKKFGSFFTFDKLLASDVHPAIIKYVSAELDFLIYEDRKKLLRDSVFDYSGAEIAKHFALISEEIKKGKKISFEDVKKLMLQAVSFNINFLVRPRWSLVKLAFNEAENRSAEEIKLAFNYIYFYDYIKNIFLAYLGKRKLSTLSVTEFEAILTKIDKELFSNEPEKLLDNTIFTFAEFFNEGAVNKTKISPSYIELFLKEKNLIEYQFKIRKYFSADINQNFNLEDVRKVLYSSAPVEIPTSFKEELELEESSALLDVKSEVQTSSNKNKVVKESPAAEDMTSKEEPADEIKLKEEEPKIRGIEEEAETKEDEGKEEVDLLSIYDSELKSIEAELNEIKSDLSDFEFEVVEDEPKSNTDYFLAEEDKKEELSDTASDEPGENDDVISLDADEEKDKIDLHEEKGFAEQTSSNNKKIVKRFDKDIYEYLSRKDIRKIISTVFNEDRDDFESTMEKISECISYDEATEILKTVFLTYRVNPYSKEAVTLTNSVSNYFDQV